MAQSALFLNATTLVWQLPSSPTVAGLIFLAHGCRQSPHVWFSRSSGCPKCSARPEERCMAAAAVARGFAVVSASSRDSHGCWTGDDLQPVTLALEAWRSRVGDAVPAATPLFLLGPSSGGWFAGQLARRGGALNVAALAMQVMVPTLADVTPPLPSGKPFPPLQIVLLQKDGGKRKEYDTLAAASWPREHLQLLMSSPKPVGPSFFSDGIPGLDASASANVRAALLSAGHIDGATSLIRSHPSRGSWREVVLGALGRKRSAYPQQSLQVAMDGIFARLDMAYGYHASTCEHIGATLDFFEAHGRVARGADGAHTHSRSSGHTRSRAHAKPHASRRLGGLEPSLKPSLEVPRVTFLVLSLNSSARRWMVESNRRRLPELEMARSVNGFDRRETVGALLSSGLRYHIHSYCGFSRFGTYGSLANYLSKYLALRMQLERRLPYLALLEDDMKLNAGFRDFVHGAVRRSFFPTADPTRASASSSLRAGLPELLVLGTWGEGYVTSLASARRIVARIDAEGIPMNIDAMLNDGHAGRALHVPGAPWSHRVPPNEGDCLRTPHIRQAELPKRALAVPPDCSTPERCLAWVRRRREKFCRP